MAGLLWYQGESDTETEAAVQQWPDRFRAFLSALRSELAPEQFPVIAVSLGQISSERRRDPRFRYWDQMQRIQRELDLPGVTVVDAAAVQLDIEDGLHLSTAGQLQLGKILAAALEAQLAR